MNDNEYKLKSYKEWIYSKYSLNTETKSYAEYLKYVEQWFSAYFDKPDPSKYTPKEYEAFLKQLKFIINDPSMREYMENVDWDDASQVKDTILIFAKKLKDKTKAISLKRGDSIYTFQLYKIYGTPKSYEIAIKKTIIEYLILNNIDYSINDFKNIDIWIENIYDDSEYHDKDPTLPATEYFDGIDDYTKSLIEFGFIGTELSGIPFDGSATYINHYDGETLQDYNKKAQETFLGETHYNILSSGDIEEEVKSKYPWRNLPNRFYPTIAIIEVPNLTYTIYTYGEYQLPKNLGMPIAIGKEKYFKEKYTPNDSGTSIGLNPYLFAGGYSFTKKYQVAPVDYNPYLNWITVYNASKEAKGVIRIGDSIYQSMIPYHTSNELGNANGIGITTPNAIYDPWYFTEDNVWRNTLKYEPDFRGIYSVDEWTDNHNILTGKQVYWGMDIFGMNYALNTEEHIETLSDRFEITDGVVYIRTLDGVIYKFSEYYDITNNEALLNTDFNSLSLFKIYDDMIFALDSEGNMGLQKIIIKDGTPRLDNKHGKTISNDEKFSGVLYDSNRGVVFIATTIENEIGNPMLKIYEFDGTLKMVYNMLLDTSFDIIEYKDIQETIFIYKYPQFVYFKEADKFCWAFTSYSNDGMNIRLFQYRYKNGIFVYDDLIHVIPEMVDNSTNYEKSEFRNLIQVSMEYDSILLLFEGIETNNKYIQVIAL